VADIVIGSSRYPIDRVERVSHSLVKNRDAHYSIDARRLFVRLSPRRAGQFRAALNGERLDGGPLRTIFDSSGTCWKVFGGGEQSPIPLTENDFVEFDLLVEPSPEQDSGVEQPAADEA